MIAVTTHARLRGIRYTIPVLFASTLIGRDLRTADGCDRYANVISGPKDIWTLTIWRDARAMRAAMTSGAHGRAMWERPRWLACYWGMRWRPGRPRGGEWEGKPWTRPDQTAPAVAVSQPLSVVLRALPALRAAVDGSVQLSRREVEGATALTYRLKAPVWTWALALRDLRRLRTAIAADDDVFRVSLGVGSGGALYLLAVLRSTEASQRLQSSSKHRSLVDRWGSRVWCFGWDPESEFGEWDGRKLRVGQLADAALLLDVSLPAMAESAGQARRAVARDFVDADPGALNTLLLLVSEAVTNSVRHAGLSSDDRIGVQLRASGEWVRAEVTDRGRRFEPRVPVSKSPDEESGWGLFTINRVARRWGIIPGTPRRLWFELHVPPASRDRVPAGIGQGE